MTKILKFDNKLEIKNNLFNKIHWNIYIHVIRNNLKLTFKSK